MSAARTSGAARTSLRREFQAWLDTIDPSARDAMVSPGTWLGVTCCAALVIATAGLVPWTAKFFHLRAELALLCYMPTILLGLSIGVLQQRDRLSLMAFGVWSTIGSALFQAFMWSLVALSEMPGAVLMASLPIFLAAYHGHAFRSSPRCPYIALGTLFGVAFAFALNHSPAHMAVYGVAGPIAAAMSLVLGLIARGNHRATVLAAAMRDAVDAQVLREQTRQMASVTQALLRLQGTSHDAGTALSSVLFSLEQLAVEAHRLAAQDPKAHSLGEMASRLVGSLDRLRQLLDEARGTGIESRPNLELVDVPQVVRSTVGELSGRLASVRISVADVARAERESGPRPVPRLVVPLYGGSGVLRRVVANLVTNAAEGNGVDRAGRVDIEVGRGSEPGTVELRVSDDGPGFSSTLLDYPIRAFHSTKPGGTGLGLYTVGQLVAASGGSLRVSNRDQDSGAVVVVVLREELAHARAAN